MAIAAAVILLSLALLSHRAVDSITRRRVASYLQSINATSAEGMRIWMSTHRQAARQAADDETVQGIARRLAEVARRDPAQLVDAPEQGQLKSHLKFLLSSDDYIAFSIVDDSGLVLATLTKSLIGTRPLTPAQLQHIAKSPDAILPPFPHPATGAGIMLASARILDGKRPLGSVLLVMDAEGHFSQFLQTARPGSTGETYAFSRDGKLLSASRFRSQLVELGLLPSDASSSALRVELRDPGVDLRHEAAQLPVEQRPLTAMAQQATTGSDGANLDGYRDYRGVDVVGAWQWLDEYDFGIATEIDVAEAFELRERLRLGLYGLLGLLALAAAGLVAYGYALALSKRKSRHAEQAARELGQYTLGEKLGQGGMGAVYSASHRLLRRPTAIKVISGDQDAQLIRRFEREVQMTSQLTHPNTIVVYDYGRTTGGAFYYAMEYLEGSDLYDIVRSHGPLPGSRVVHFLLQACASLREAHDRGMVHRDVKAANLFACKRGGDYDVLKVLDFGLVKSTATTPGQHLASKVDVIIGTPGYIAPEFMIDADAVTPQIDVYALGVVGYFLLTAHEPFTGDTAMEVCIKAMTEAPSPFHRFEGVDASRALQKVVMACLEKLAADRPQGVQVLADCLAHCPEAGQWSQADAKAWWDTHPIRRRKPDPDAPMSRTVLEVQGDGAQ